MGIRVIIPVAGVGSRLRPHTHTAPKAMLQVAGKPMLGHILDELTKYDVDEITLVVGHLGEAIREYVTRTYHFKFKFVTQSELRGLGHAIWLTGDLYRHIDSPLLIILGDTIFDADFDTIIGSNANWIGVREVSDPKRFGIVELEGERIRAMIEKPANPPTNLAIVGIYYFTQCRPLFECLDQIIDQDRTTAGEYQLTDALQMMLDRGIVMKPFMIDGWYDCGKPETLLSTNRELLTKHIGAGSSTVTAQFPSALIRQPVSIGEGVTIEDSIVGPHVTVADHVVIRHSIIHNSILSQGATVENMVLDASIIADNAKADGHVYTLNIGDSSELKVG